MNFMCEKCSSTEREVSFPTLKMLSEHKRGGHGITITTPLDNKSLTGGTTSRILPSEKPVEKKEIVLEYKFTGVHDLCGTEVKTLEMDVESKHFVIAYCMPCNKQLISREVVNLKESGVIEVGKKQEEQKKESKKRK